MNTHWVTIEPDPKGWSVQGSGSNVMSLRQGRPHAQMGRGLSLLDQGPFILVICIWHFWRVNGFCKASGSDVWLVSS